MSYIAVLDFENLDNGIFLHAFAKALARHKQPGLVIHGDSEYTNRILQTGVMREQAARRAIKDLNLRLTALFADAGVPAVAMHGFHRDAVMVSAERDKGTSWQDMITIRSERLTHPPGTVLLLSCLAGVSETDGASEALSSTRTTQILPLPELARALMRELHIEQLILFSHAKGADFIKLELPETLSKSEDRSFLEEHISRDFLESDLPFHLATPERFGREEHLHELPRVQ